MASDRIFGLVVVLVALAYIASATQIPTSFLSDPLGPRAFPYLIGAVMAVCGLVVMLRPDAEPDWPDLKTLGEIAIAVVVLVGYAYALKPLGFLIPTAVVAGILSWQISGRKRAAALTGLGLSIGLFVIFRYALGLGLQAVPKGWLG